MSAVITAAQAVCKTKGGDVCAIMCVWCQREALAVIASLRAPSDAMRKALWDEDRAGGDPLDCFAAAIDAALSQPHGDA